MKKLFSVLKYTRNYKGYTALNILFNIFFAVFSAATLALIAPFLELLFKTNLFEIGVIVMKGPPPFSLSSEFFKRAPNYYLALLIFGYQKSGALMIICVLVFALTLLKNACRYFAMYFVAPIRNGVVRDLRNRMYKKSLNLPLSYYSEEKKGDLMSRMTTDVQEIEWSIMQTLEMIFREPLTVIIMFTLMLLISAKLTLYIICLLPIAALIIALLGKSLKNASRKTKETLGGLISIIEETLGSLKVIKAFNAAGPMSKKFEETNQTFYKQSVRVYRKTDLASPLTETIVTGILMLILFIGGKMVFDNELTAALFITYFGLASQLIPPIKQITTSYNNIQKGIASEERIDKILLADDLIHDKADAIELKGFNTSVEYKNVSFAYHKGDERYVLKDINLVVEKGKMIALVGQSGSGKTTLADMLPRFYDCDKGELLVDGKNIKDLSSESLRKHIGVVTQESTLFNDSIANNISFGLTSKTEEEIISAAKIANAHEFISAFPNGYQTNIGDRGSKLSGGQKQRLSIARAVLRNPEILILDEATSALDTESEKLVQDALTSLMKNRTSIVIAHRLSTIMNADEIIVMSKGEIIERGSHSQLIALNGNYKRLCDLQSFK
ncbi:MAG: antibiotic transporter ATP-binding protein [Bacteroidetes bacterium]|nr:antibiotic transporter ATP-binding protein [Bacteroidota bacterium]